MKPKVTICALGMDRFGSTKSVVEQAKLLKVLVGAWGFEPQTPTVLMPTPVKSSSA
jgi:hypothetical protein